jgi:cytoskeletal protein CcmA (bactofilin family)
VEGSIEGTIHSEGEVTIAPSGVVTGTIHAKHLIVTGRVEGVFKIDECLEIHGTGWVEGEVEVGSLVVDEGGTLQGTCTRRGIATPATGKGKPDERRLVERPGISPVNGLPVGNESLYVKAFDKKP